MTANAFKTLTHPPLPTICAAVPVGSLTDCPPRNIYVVRSLPALGARFIRAAAAEPVKLQLHLFVTVCPRVKNALQQVDSAVDSCTAEGRVRMSGQPNQHSALPKPYNRAQQANQPLGCSSQVDK